MVISEVPHDSAGTKKDLNSRVVPLDHTQPTFSPSHLTSAATLLVILTVSTPADDHISDCLPVWFLSFFFKNTSKAVQLIQYAVHYAMYIKIRLKREAQANHTKSYAL